MPQCPHNLFDVVDEFLHLAFLLPRDISRCRVIVIFHLISFCLYRQITKMILKITDFRQPFPRTFYQIFTPTSTIYCKSRHFSPYALSTFLPIILTLSVNETKCVSFKIGFSQLTRFILHSPKELQIIHRILKFIKNRLQPPQPSI